MRYLLTVALAASLYLLPFAAQAQFNPNNIDGRCPGPFIDAPNDAVPVSDRPLLETAEGDIAFAWVMPASDYPAMELGLQFYEPLPVYPEVDFNGFFFFDQDRDRTNNDPAGPRAGADFAVSLMYGAQDRTWNTVVWNYDSVASEWNGRLNPEVLYAFDSGGIIIHVPYDLFPEDADWPWRGAAALSDGEADRFDSYPDTSGEQVTCGPDGEEPTIISGLPQSTDEAGPKANGANSEPATNRAGEPWWVYLWAVVIFSGLISMALKGLRERRARGSAGGDAPKPPQEPSAPPPAEPKPPQETPAPPPAEPEEEEDPCRCPKCRLFIAVGGQRDRAVSSAANLGRAIKRDTLAADNLDNDDRCIKVVHFTDNALTRGRYVAGGANDSLEWQNLRSRTVTTADHYGEVCLWQEVIVVHHGERKSKVKKIMQSLQTLLPAKPIQRLVLYYCGGEGTLPQAEFQALASSLGRRLKQIPERCRPEQVDIYLAPTITFGGKEHFTKLVIEQTGLISYQGQMKHFTVNEDGVVTAHGNQRPPGGQLFGEVPLGQLGANPNLDAQAYRDHWREIARLPLSDIERYRERIKDAGLPEPPTTPRERQKQGFVELLGEARAGQISAAEWDELVELRSKRAAREWLRAKFGDQPR
jgi:hypothetical protein